MSDSATLSVTCGSFSLEFAIAAVVVLLRYMSGKPDMMAIFPNLDRPLFGFEKSCPRSESQ